MVTGISSCFCLSELVKKGLVVLIVDRSGLVLVGVSISGTVANCQSLSLKALASSELVEGHLVLSLLIVL